MTNSRKRRGRETERILANHLQRIWPHATANTPGAAGPDILHTPGAAIEAKARRGLDLPAWLRQTHRNAHSTELPILIIRLDGAGPTTVGNWPAVLTLDDLLNLLGKEPHCHNNGSPSASTPPTSPPSASPAGSYAPGTTRTSQPGPATTNLPSSASNSTE